MMQNVHCDQTLCILFAVIYHFSSLAFGNNNRPAAFQQTEVTIMSTLKFQLAIEWLGDTLFLHESHKWRIAHINQVLLPSYSARLCENTKNFDNLMALQALFDTSSGRHDTIWDTWNYPSTRTLTIDFARRPSICSEILHFIQKPQLEIRAHFDTAE